MMTTDTYAPNFDTHDFRADVTDEVTVRATPPAGAALTTTEITLASGRADVRRGRRGMGDLHDRQRHVRHPPHERSSGSATDQLLSLHDFVTAASTTAGTFTIAWHASGLWTLDFTP